METKRCSRCKQEKEMSAFGRDAQRRDGHSGYCKACRSMTAQQRYAAGLVTRRFERKICQYCKNEYQPTGSGQMFCSVACRWKAVADPKFCAKCGKQFQPFHKTQRYCSRQCKFDAGIGFRRLNPEGYIIVRVPKNTPGVRKDRIWILEHRYVMQQHLGRPLSPTETIHHKNGDKTDNRLENLQLKQGRHGKHAAFRCRDCGSHNIEPLEV